MFRVALIGSRELEKNKKYEDDIKICYYVCLRLAQLKIKFTSGLCELGMDGIAQKAYSKALVLGWVDMSHLDIEDAGALNKVRDKRLMVFTSLLRTLNFVGHSRIDQCYGLFVKFEKEYPLIDGYTRTGKAVDHRNMRNFIDNYKLGEVDV